MIQSNKEEYLSKYSISAYKKQFGSYTNFLNRINEQPYNFRNIPTKEQLIENYYIVKKKLGKQPSLDELTKQNSSKYSPHIYSKYFGTWNKFIEFIHEPILCNTKRRNYHKKVSKEELIDNYFKLKESLGRRPLKLECYNHSLYLKYFKSWYNFLRFIHEPIPVKLERETNGHTKEELISEYYRVKKILNRQPRAEDFKGKNKVALLNVSSYQDYFGTWNNFLKSINEPLHLCRVKNKKELIYEYYRVKKILGRKPFCKDFTKKNNFIRFEKSAYYRFFGSWNNFLKSINESQNENIGEI